MPLLKIALVIRLNLIWVLSNYYTVMCTAIYIVEQVVKYAIHDLQLMCLVLNVMYNTTL